MNDSDEQLMLHIEALEVLLGNKKECCEDIKDRYAMAKSDGFDPKVLKAVIARRAKAREDVEEFDALVQTYEEAIQP